MVLIGMIPLMVLALRPLFFVPLSSWTRRLIIRRYVIIKGTLLQNLARSWLQQWIATRKILVQRRSRLKEFLLVRLAIIAYPYSH